jgi:hypothetical protein
MMFIVFQRFGVPPLGGIACGYESQQNRLKAGHRTAHQLFLKKHLTRFKLDISSYLDTSI